MRGRSGDGSGRWGKEAGEQFVNMGARLDLLVAHEGFTRGAKTVRGRCVE